ncbi:methylmalonyl-CoA epimerase [Bartonella sp. HY761]|uniref:methylmalonyl-CoA epimerase n=1 Tax=Bartonella sp. HY761 TaxID=2979330 RepID=UPI0021E2DF16|nr:methylmalonyl-CoA epimerase [Bartonella sp. HY761]UXN07953.1 methylmalonyl-CoA epimerase [Bartonella sp. HY761]
MSQFGRLNHVAIAVPNLEQAAKPYQMLGAEVSSIEDLPEHGVSVVFITFENSKIELLYPLGEHSPIAGFLDKNPNGGVHHICFEVDDILAMRDKLRANNFRILGDGTPKIGAHGKPVLFIHPKDFDGTLIEIEQA